jgi:hypothetical protein
MSRSYSSNWESVGSTADPDVIYYNATIINNNTDDTKAGFAFQDPLIKFNETRAKSIVRDAALYQFSIVRFVVNGGNLDLPLFIPSIQSYTGQKDPNLTDYAFGLQLSFTVPNATPGTSTVFSQTGAPSYVIYSPENKNPILAPLPQPPCAPTFQSFWNASVQYYTGQIVSGVNLLGLNNNVELVFPPPYYKAVKNPPVGTSPTAVVRDASGNVITYWEPCGTELGRPQDVSTRYYWVQTFQHWVNLCNTAIDFENQSLFNNFNLQWAGVAGNTPANNPFYDGALLPSPGPSYAKWLNAFPNPVMNWVQSTGLFTMTYPSYYANPAGYVPVAGATLQSASLWMNTNAFGLFANFPATYYNTTTGDGSLPDGVVFPEGFAYKMEVESLNFGGNVLLPAEIRPTPVSPAYTGNWIVMTQETISTSTLWSPVESIVFLSNLLPLQNEDTAAPNTYGSGNIGNSSAVAQPAFQPIITDIANDLSADPFAWKKMLYYAPTAEYRMADFQNSKSEIKNIDIQVFWKNRLNNELYPVSMYNLSSVSIKIMFRKKNGPITGMAKSERTSLY